jgi:hypothetical protein
MGEHKKRRCCFCGAVGPLTKEHLFSEWTHAIVPQVGNGRYVKARSAGEPKHTVTPIPDSLLNKQIKVVCGRCNNGWMNGIEKAVKPIMTPLLRGEETTLTPADQETLAVWITLKSMVGELGVQNIKIRVISDEFRQEFYRTKSMPAGWHVWIGFYGGTTYCIDAHYNYESGKSKVNTLYNGILGVDFSMRHKSVFCLGKLFMLAHSATLPLPAAHYDYPLLNKLVPIPGNGAIDWPPRMVLDDADGIASNTLLQSTGNNKTFTLGPPPRF